MKKLFITSILTVTLMTATIFGADLNGLGVNNTSIALASSVTSIKSSTPSLSAQTRTASTVSLNIGKVSAADGYNIYRTSSLNGNYRYVGYTKSTSYVDKKVKPASSYYYKVRAYKTVNGKKYYSKASAAVSISPTLSKTSYISANGASKSAIAVAWSKVNGANGYNVYRAASKDGTYSYIGRALTNSYKDAGLQSGKTYYYCIRATKPVNGVSYYGVYSDKVPGTTLKSQTVITPISTPVPTKKPQPTTGPTPTAKPVPTSTPGGSDQKYDSSFASQVLKIVNEERTKAGLKELTMSESLVAPANKRAQEIKQSFSHTRPNGSAWSTVLDEYNVRVQTAGENIAYGYNTPQKVMDAWMNSSGHRANILGANYNHIGIGVYEVNGTVYCTQLFSN